jgi:hypothetical protein
MTPLYTANEEAIRKDVSLANAGVIEKLGWFNWT